MFKKEINDVLKQTFYFLLVTIALPWILILTSAVRNLSFFQIFFPIFQFALLFWALFLGISLFSSEQGQGGMEYLLSLPYSRLRLLGLKVLPRATVVMLLYVLFLLLYTRGGEDAAAFPIFYFTLLYCALYFISVFLSASSDNFLVQFVLSLFSLSVLFFLLTGILWTAFQAKGYVYYSFGLRQLITESTNQILARSGTALTIGLLLPLPISFVLSFKKFDLRPAKNFNLRFIKVFVPVFVIALSVSFIFAYQTLDFGYTSYVLTLKRQVIESKVFSNLKIRDERGVSKLHLDSGYIRILWEEIPYIYYRDRNSRIGRLNTIERSTEILYESPQGKRIDSSQSGFGQMIAFFERKRDYSETDLIFLDTDSREVKRIPLTDEMFAGEVFKDYHNWRIFGADTVGGRRFWLMFPAVMAEELPIYRVWEDGRIDRIGASRKSPCFVNRILFTFTEKEITATKHHEGHFNIQQRIPNSEDFHFGWYVHAQNKLTNHSLEEIYGRRIVRVPDYQDSNRNFQIGYARLNLENYEIEILNDLDKFQSFISPTFNTHYVLAEDGISHEVKLYVLKRGKPNLVKTFNNVDLTYGLRGLKFFESGILAKQKRELRIYTLPDFEEIRFKKFRR